MLKNDGRGAFAEVILREAVGRLSAPLEGTARCAQNRARLVRALRGRTLRRSPRCSVTDGGVNQGGF
jgi:hypothetical protein